MENLTMVEIFAFGVIIAAVGYFYADARAKAQWNEKLSDEIKHLRKEMREWQNKALIKHGTSPLDAKAVKKMTVGTQEITPKVVTRQQLEHRLEQPSQQSTVNIHAHDVSYSRVARTVEKAAEIIDAYK